MKLLVLAGGFGTRLQSALSNVPKALAPVCGTPFLRLQLENWIGQGIDEIIFLLHHQADQIILFLHLQRKIFLKECDINWVVESTPMDTGGAIANAVKTLNLRGEFLVINADTWLSTGMVELARSISPSIGLVYLENISRYGQVKYDKDFHIVKFSEKAVTSMPGWINAGIFHLDPLFFLDWNGKPFSLESHLFVELAQSRQLHAVQLNTDFLDIGIPADYKRFCRWVHEGRKLPL